MSRRVFFSFHFENDVVRTSQVRNTWVTKGDAAGFVDKADFEEVEKKGTNAVHKWIRDQLHGTSVTVVLIGSDTCNREYVQYEVQQSYARGNGMLGIYIHQCKNFAGKTSAKGSNSFGEIGKDEKGNAVYFSKNFKCYDWIDDKGYENLGKWIEEAAKDAGK